MDLRCNKTNCKFNDRYACRAKDIHVSKSTECRTFEHDKQKDNLPKLSSTMFEQAPDIAPFRAKDKVGVLCHAPCLFNKDGVCTANGITVLDNKEAICGTFIEK